VAPEQTPACAVPANDGFWTNNRQAGAPIAQARQQGQADPGCRIDAPRSDAALLLCSKLTPENQNFGCRRPPRSEGKRGQREQVDQQTKNDLEEVCTSMCAACPRPTRVSWSKPPIAPARIQAHPESY